MLNIKKNLIKYGLDEKEVSMYLAALSLGESNMTELSKESGLKRATSYAVYKSLEDKGLMGQFKKTSGLHFIALSPKNLENKAIENLENIKSIIPELDALYSANVDKPKITYYEGKEAYLRIAEDSISESNTTLRIIGSLSEAHNVVGKEYDIGSYIPKRISRNINIRVINTADMLKDNASKTNIDELREVRILPRKTKLTSMTLIHGNTVVIVGSKNQLSIVVIENPEIAHDEREKFDVMWGLLDKN
jgi:sugar-specific transcriptional regulator TrmB